MTIDTWVTIAASAVGAATPLTYAALGEVVTERAGVLNLGVEGMMLVGAMAGFAVGIMTGSLWLAYLAAALGGAMIALLFAVLTLSLQTNQVATGLALTLFGIGLSAFAGRGFVGMPIARVPLLHLPGLSDLPVLGRLLFSYDLPVYGSLVMCAAIAWFLQRTRAGLRLRAVGEQPGAAHALGEPVIRIRYLAALFGGAMSGIAGAYLSTAVTPMWAEGMSAGRGWIALALVVFGTWRPWRVLGGAYLFGLVTVLQLYAQGLGIHIPSEFLSMLPYIATIVVLVFVCRDGRTILLNQPASLGRSFHPGA
ncbi:MAG TPA: ABC transporter permease [Steroidobacteraceae bacterium]|jgi:simple sugar transport system permease protein|nr:ABC transporter permease [Steroidobacteraceae bacterium]